MTRHNKRMKSVQNKYSRYVSLKFQMLISCEWCVLLKWFYHQMKEELFAHLFIQCTILLVGKYDYWLAGGFCDNKNCELVRLEIFLFVVGNVIRKNFVWRMFHFRSSLVQKPHKPSYSSSFDLPLPSCRPKMKYKTWKLNWVFICGHRTHIKILGVFHHIT